LQSLSRYGAAAERFVADPGLTLASEPLWFDPSRPSLPSKEYWRVVSTFARECMSPEQAAYAAQARR